MSEKYSESQKKLTQESIKTALYQLLKKHPLKDISITMIADRAGVSRMGVYRHYKNKEEIIDSFLDELVEKMFKKLYPVQAKYPYKASVAYFNIIMENKEIFQIIVSSDLESQFLKKHNLYVAEYLTESMTDAPLEKNYSVYRNLFLSSGLYALSVEWIRRGMQEPIDMLAKIPSALAVEVDGDFYFRAGVPLSDKPTKERNS